MKKVKPLFTGSDWNLGTIERAWKEIDIIGKELGLDYYNPQIEIISAEQMLEGYSSNMMPVMYNHWSYGKSFVENESMYKKGKMGLAHEVVINTNPMLTYLIEDNTATLQTLVLAHAVCGHGSFFKTNYLFKEWTDAESIIDYLKFAKNYILKCEERYGEDEVELLLDAAHTIQYYGVDKYKRAPKLKPELEEKRAQEWSNYIQENYNQIWSTIPNHDPFPLPPPPNSRDFPEENLLYFIEKNSPRLRPWQKEVLRIVRKISQYFYPQMQTKMMNEGWASFIHYEIMEILEARGLITEGSYLEFLKSHCGVTCQHDWDHNHYNGLNPYTIGFTIFRDLKRLIVNPTEEDLKWFPDIAGQKDYLTILKEIVANYKDESFALQFLSPKVIRDLKLMALRDDEGDKYYQVSTTHDPDDVYKIREALSRHYDLSRKLPQIEITAVDWDGDRSLDLQHTVYDGTILEYESTKETLEYIKYLWGFDVMIQYKDKFGNEVDRNEPDE